MNWTVKHIKKVEDFLTLFGDLILVKGQIAVEDAIKSLPYSPSEMDNWCDQWLSASGYERLHKSLSTH